MPGVSADAHLSREAVSLCRAAIVQQSKSFALASRLLPPGVREEAWILYAWCRRADDAIDGAPAEARGAALGQLREELRSVYDDPGPPADPTLAAFREVVRRRAVPRDYPEALLEGMAMDVHGQRYETVGDLLRYCYRVAGTVGLMMCHVMGLRRDDALTHAVHLGMAMQLTNICRDVAEDWRLGRLYLPADRLAGEGLEWLTRVPRGGELPPQARAPLAKVVDGLLDDAEAFYRSGERGLPALSWRCALAVATARAVYGDIGQVLRRRRCDVLRGRARVSTGRKLWLVVGAGGRMVAVAPGYWWRRLRAGAGLGPPGRTFQPPDW